MMTINSYSTALSYVDALMASKTCPQIRSHLTRPSSDFLQWLNEESRRLEQVATSGIDSILSSPEKLEEFRSYYHFFLAVEEKGNNLEPMGKFGSVLCQKIASSLASTKAFTREFVDIVSLEKRSNFDALVCDAIPEQLKKNKDEDGLRSFMSSLSNSALSPSTQNTITSVLVEALDAVETSTRFEILARVDAYIRSGHAREDMEGDTIDAKQLREAIAKVEATRGSKILHRAAVQEASTELFASLDRRMHKVKIHNGRAIDYGNYAHQPGYKPKRDMPRCAQRAEPGTLDVAIPIFGRPNAWLTGMTTSATDISMLNKESEQHFRHNDSDITWWFIDPKRGPKETPRPLPEQTSYFSIIYSALVNTNSKKNKLAEQIGVKLDAPVVQSINDLVLLQLLSNTKTPNEIPKLHIGCIGANVNLTLSNALGTPEFSKVAAFQLIEAINGLTKCTVDGNKIAASSTLVEALHISASVLNSYSKNEYLLEHAPVKEWEASLETLEESLVKGDFKAISALQSAVGFISSKQDKYFRTSSEMTM